MRRPPGAVVGALLSMLIPLKFRARPDQVIDANAPQPVTVRRRLVGMLCDFLIVTLTGLAVNVVVVVVADLRFGVRDVGESWWVTALSLGVPFVLTLAYTLAAGRTIGHAAVQLRYVGSRMPAPLARLLRFIAGIGGYQILDALPVTVSSWATPAFVILAVVLVLTTKDHGGLPGLISGQNLIDSRSTPQTAATSSPSAGRAAPFPG